MNDDRQAYSRLGYFVFKVVASTANVHTWLVFLVAFRTSDVDHVIPMGIGVNRLLLLDRLGDLFEVAMTGDAFFALDPRHLLGICIEMAARTSQTEFRVRLVKLSFRHCGAGRQGKGGDADEDLHADRHISLRS